MCQVVSEQQLAPKLLTLILKMILMLSWW